MSTSTRAKESVAMNKILTAVVVMAYVLIVFGVNFILETMDDAWSARDWATNVVFAVGLTGLTILFSIRQSSLQESLAKVAITEKISEIYAQVDKIKESTAASACYQLLIEARAGFHMYKHADKQVRSELVRTTSSSIEAMESKVHSSIYPYAYWDDGDWSQVREAATALKKQILGLPSKHREIIKHTSILGNLGTIESTKSMPSKVFIAAYRDRHEGREIRVLFEWSVLEKALSDGRAEICNYRFRIEEFFVGRRVYSPWHFTRFGEHVSHASSRAFQLGEIGDVNSWWHRLPDLFKQRTKDLQTYLTNHPKGKRHVIEVATLQVTPTAFLVLDGNHRLSAAKLKRERYRNEIPVDVSEYRIIFHDPEVARMTCKDADMLATNLSRKRRR